jgi:hypothetical protein
MLRVVPDTEQPAAWSEGGSKDFRRYYTGSLITCCLINLYQFHYLYRLNSKHTGSPVYMVEYTARIQIMGSEPTRHMNV